MSALDFDFDLDGPIVDRLRPGAAPATEWPRLLRSGPGDPCDHRVHVARFRPLPEPARPVEWLGQLRASGLLGRGGAAFPTAIKVDAVARRRRGEAVVVVNATEGEPASLKDHVLAVAAPHLVIDGALVLAAVVGASSIFVCVDRADVAAYGALRRSVRTRGLDDRIVVLGAPARYVAGEASALCRWIGGGEARPVWQVRPDQAGVSGRPTLVQNAETVAHVALVARHGSAWFRSVGTSAEPGSMLVTVSGDVTSPGVLEIARGTPLTTVLDTAGAGEAPGALLLGGYGGTWTTPHQVRSLHMSNESFARVGAAVGTGVVIVAGRHRCGLAETARLARWFAGESAGQCGQCWFGLPAIAELLDRLVQGRESAESIPRLWRWLDDVEGRGACAHPDLAVHMIRSALQCFADDFAAHVAGRPCPGARAAGLLACPDTTHEAWT